jgi:hypothetical protein
LGDAAPILNSSGLTADSPGAFVYPTLSQTLRGYSGSRSTRDGGDALVLVPCFPPFGGNVLLYYGGIQQSLQIALMLFKFPTT